MRAICTNSVYVAPAEGTHLLPGTHVNGVGGSGRGWVGCGEVGGCLGISPARLGWRRLPRAGPKSCLRRAGTARGAPGISGAPSSTSSALPSFEGPGFTAGAGAFLPFHLCCLSQRKPISLFFNCLKVFFGGFSGYFEDNFSQMCFFFFFFFFFFSFFFFCNFSSSP